MNSLACMWNTSDGTGYEALAYGKAPGPAKVKDMSYPGGMRAVNRISSNSSSVRCGGEAPMD